MSNGNYQSVSLEPGDALDVDLPNNETVELVCVAMDDKRNVTMELRWQGASITFKVRN